MENKTDKPYSLQDAKDEVFKENIFTLTLESLDELYVKAAELYKEVGYLSIVFRIIVHNKCRDRQSAPKTQCNTTIQPNYRQNSN